MKRRVLAVLSAVMLFTMGTTTVLAASPTVETTEAKKSTQIVTTSIVKADTPVNYAKATTVSDGFEVEEVTETIVDAAAVAVQNSLLNDVAALGKALKKSVLTNAATDSSKKVTAEMLTVVEVNPKTATKDENGNYVVTLKLATIKAGDIIAVLHYGGSMWETIVPDSVKAGEVTFSTDSLSPISIVKLEVSDVKAAPKTGASMPATVVIIAIIGLAGAVVCGKKYFA